jgi:hypothetical protein
MDHWVLMRIVLVSGKCRNDFRIQTGSSRLFDINQIFEMELISDYA